MESKKMTFSPSQLELYVELIAKSKGLKPALDFFYKVEPHFNNMAGAAAKNWPAYSKIMRMKEEADKRSKCRRITYELPNE